MSGSPEINQLHLLLQRRDIMDHIVSGTTKRTELVHEVADSRSTVYRALDSLEEQGLVDDEHGNYSPTPLGKLLFQEVNRLCETSREINNTKPLLDSIPTKSLDPRIFSDAEVRISDRYSPDEHLGPLFEAMSLSDSIRVLLPTLTRRLAEQINSIHSVDDIELILERKVIERFRSLDDNQIPFQDIFNAATVITIDKHIPVGVIIISGRCPQTTLLAFRNGQIQGAIYNSSQHASIWAKAYYDQFREIADSPTVSPTVSPSDGTSASNQD